MDAALAARKLSAWSIAARVIAAATPLTVVAGVVPSGIAATGGNTFPIVFLAIAVVFGVFSVGYLAAARRFPPVDASGAFYCLISHGLGRPAGVGAGWVAAVTYAALPIGLYGMIGTAITPLLTDMFAVTVPWQLVATITALLVGALGLANIATSSRVLLVLVSAEIAVIIIVAAGNFLHPAPGSHGTSIGLDPRLLFGAAAVTIARLTLGVLGYVGAELTVVHTQDARYGHHTIARATTAAIAALSVTYILCSASLTTTLGADGVTAAAQADPGGMFLATTQSNLGHGVATILRVLFATSVLAGAVAFHGATSRYAHFLGRNHTAPAVLGKRSRRYGTPAAASLTQTALALIVIAVVSLTGADPVHVLFYTGGTAGTVGILILLTLTALSTAMLFRRPASGHRWIAAAAVASTVLLGGLVGTVVVNLDTLLGVPADSSVPDIVRISYLALFLAGALRALWLRTHQPGAYAVIGTARPAPV